MIQFNVTHCSFLSLAFLSNKDFLRHYDDNGISPCLSVYLDLKGSKLAI